MNTRPVLTVAATVLSVFALSACGGGGVDSAPAPAPAPSPVATQEGGASDGGGGVIDSQEGAGDVSTGSALGDVNRGDYVAMGMDPGEAMSIDWAGDVGTPDGSFIEYPDGLRIDFAGATPGSAPVSEEQGDLDPDKALVRLTVTATNAGPDALPLDGGMRPLDVFEGENLTEVSSLTGYFDEEGEVSSVNDASVIAPGSSIDVFMSYEVTPGADLQVEILPAFFGEEHTPFVFYGITAP